MRFLAQVFHMNQAAAESQIQENVHNDIMQNLALWM